MVTQYIKIVVDPAGDNYTVEGELLTGTIIDRKVNAPSSFQFRVENLDADNIDKFAVDDKVDIYVDSNTTPTTKIMTGIIMDIDLERDQYMRNILTIRGEDYLTVLAERLARASFPGAVDVSTILINLLDEFASGEYTTTNVHTTGATVTNFTVGAQTTLLALMRRLADLPGSSYDFYLDGSNDLVWHPRASASSTGVWAPVRCMYVFLSRVLRFTVMRLMFEPLRVTPLSHEGSARGCHTRSLLPSR